jgi:MoaA/NifB/PqqE/SkfB family radical SAM enzyme
MTAGPDARFKLIAVQRARAQGITALSDLAVLLSDPDPSVGNAAAAAIHSLAPLAALPERWHDPSPRLISDPAGIPAWLLGLCSGPASEEALVTLFVDGARSLPDAALDSYLDRLAVFQGIQRSLHAALASSGMGPVARRFARKVAALRRAQYPLQVSLSATMACQLRCNFCIAEDAPGETWPMMSREDIVSLSDWMSRYGITRLSLTGGEPTLYPAFPVLLKELRDRSIELNVATNGQFADPILQEIIATRPLCVSMHLAPEVVGARYELFSTNARAFVEAGIYTVIRCNLPSPDTEYRRFIRAALELGIGEIRMAIPMPNVFRVNRYAEPEEFTGFRELLSSFVSEARAQGIQTRLSKPCPPCLLDETTAREFLGNGSYTTNCPVHQTGYTNNLVIYPDLSFSPCLGLNVKVKKRIIEFPGLRAASVGYRTAVERLMRQPLFAHCSTCPLWRGGRCLGACLSYRPDPLGLFGATTGTGSPAASPCP